MEMSLNLCVFCLEINLKHTWANRFGNSFYYGTHFLMALMLVKSTIWAPLSWQITSTQESDFFHVYITLVSIRFISEECQWNRLGTVGILKKFRYIAAVQFLDEAKFDGGYNSFLRFPMAANPIISSWWKSYNLHVSHWRRWWANETYYLIIPLSNIHVRCQIA